MFIRYLGIFLLGFLLFSCGAPPAGWESADFSSGGDGDGDDQPPAETQLFLIDAEQMLEESDWDNITINSQTGWCHDPNDGTVSENYFDMTLTISGWSGTYFYTFSGGTVSAGTLAGSYTYEGPVDGEADYELRFNSDFTSATIYLPEYPESGWGDIPSTGSCE